LCRARWPDLDEDLSLSRPVGRRLGTTEI